MGNEKDWTAVCGRLDVRRWEISRDGDIYFSTRWRDRRPAGWREGRGRREGSGVCSAAAAARRHHNAARGGKGGASCEGLPRRVPSLPLRDSASMALRRRAVHSVVSGSVSAQSRERTGGRDTREPLVAALRGGTLSTPYRACAAVCFTRNGSQRALRGVDIGSCVPYPLRMDAQCTVL